MAYGLKACSCHPLNWFVYFFPGCDAKPAGLEDGSIVDSQISASSIYGSGRPASAARLNNSNFWASSGNRDNQWIQIDLLTAIPIKGITTQGSGHSLGQWVKEYHVAVGNNVAALEPIMESGSIKVNVTTYILAEATGGVVRYVGDYGNLKKIETQYPLSQLKKSTNKKWQVPNEIHHFH